MMVRYHELCDAVTFQTGDGLNLAFLANPQAFIAVEVKLPGTKRAIISFKKDIRVQRMGDEPEEVVGVRVNSGDNDIPESLTFIQPLNIKRITSNNWTETRFYINGSHGEKIQIRAPRGTVQACAIIEPDGINLLLIPNVPGRVSYGNE